MGMNMGDQEDLPPALNDDHADVAILGGGPGGYVAALTAARRGARVILVEKERLGGTCLNMGCIPTKVLASAVEVLIQTRNARAYGVEVHLATMDLAALMERKQATVDQLVGGVEQLLKARRVSVVRGVARLGEDRTLIVEGAGGVRRISAAHLILAPGSVTAKPPIEGLDLPGVLTSTEALTLTEVPARLVVIGGGVIGLEMACIYEGLGSQVTVIEMTDTVLPGATDEALARRLQTILKRRGMVIHTATTVSRIERRQESLAVWAESATGSLQVEGDRVLVATGRWPNTGGMGFEAAGLAFSGRALAVNAHLATPLAQVWAIGDAVGGWMLAHKAMVEGRVAAENATGGDRRVDYRSVANVIFTRPEMASVGLTEAQARAAGHEVKVTQFPFSANPRALTLGETEGLVRLVCELGTGRLLGVHILGPRATDLIAEGALAVQLGATADDLAWTTHGHPTLPEAMLEAALGFRDATIHTHRR
jgi:dihydrolipoamide dehydrogenase